jgi:peptidoglycan/xylan/chitin deacetylase (PgdA/CDA1 family)
MILVNIINKEFLRQKLYVFDLIFSILGLKYEIYNEKSGDEDVIISYGEKFPKRLNGCRGIFIKDSAELFNKNYLKTMPQIMINRHCIDEPIKYITEIISLFSKDKICISREGCNTKINIDIISDIFFLVTRYEEVLLKSKDIHDRFNPFESIAYKENFINRPVVNEQIELLWRELQRIDSTIVKRKAWGNKDFAFCLSHDIDTIFKYKDKFIKVIAVKILKEKNIKGAIERVKHYFRVNKDILCDPFWTFPYLLDLEKKYGFTASYYFMAGGQTKYDNIYKITNKKLEPIFKDIKECNSEIGLHGSYNSYNNVITLNKEVKLFSKVNTICGIRQHYLRFKVPYTWRVQENNKITYDTTLGYAQIGGFRGGICSPFKPYDLINNKIIDIYEIPLILMDSTLVEKEYMGLSPEEGLLYAKELIDKVKDVNGVFTLLWHNSSFDNTSKWSQWKYVYQEILKYGYSENALGVSGEDLISCIK